MPVTVRTHCRLCPTYCEIEVTIEKNRISRVKGAMCPRGTAIPQFQASSDRLIHPVERVGHSWKRISWSDALDIIADRLGKIRSRYGPQALAVTFYRGTVFWYSNLEEIVRRFCDLYGACLFSGVSTMCYDPIEMGMTLTFGKAAFPDISTRTKCVLCWGSNPYESNINSMVAIRNAKKTGGKLLVVDPRTTKTAEEADRHVKIRPGTDLALAMGLLNVIISERLYDEDFVNKWIFGFEMAEKHVKNYPPEKVEKITKVPAELVMEIARTYATSKPSAILLGNSVFGQTTNSFQAIRAIAILISITGNLDVPGGNCFVDYPPMSIGRLVDRKWGHRTTPISPARKPGAEEFELYCQMFDLAFPQSVFTAMLTGSPFPIKAAIIFAHNPLLTLPNSGAVKKALNTLDFLVVMDFFLTETAKLANIVLPATTFLETVGYLARSNGQIKMLNKVIDPPIDCWSDWKFWCELGRRMGYADHFPWKSEEEYLDSLLRQTGRSLKQALKELSFCCACAPKWRRFETEGFRTPSGKVDVYSQFLRDRGIPPLPTYEEPAESPISKPGLAKTYPLILITGGRSRIYTHSRYRNLPVLRALLPENILEINRKDAEKYGIQDGAHIFVESSRQRVKIKAKYSEILEGVVHMMHGWPESNANLLVDDRALDPVIGSPGTKALLCRVHQT